MNTRPTLGKTREAIFSMIQNSVPGARVLDLFAGSGALGLEAVSRGARRAVLCDHAADAARAIRANIAALQVSERVVFFKMHWEHALDKLQGEGELFDLIFLDPPYTMPLPPIMAGILQRELLEPEGLIIAEHDVQAQVAPPEGTALFKHRAYGDSAISIFLREEASHADRDLSGQL